MYFHVACASLTSLRGSINPVIISEEKFAHGNELRSCPPRNLAPMPKFRQAWILNCLKGLLSDWQLGNICHLGNRNPKGLDSAFYLESFPWSKLLKVLKKIVSFYRGGEEDLWNSLLCLHQCLGYNERNSFSKEC